MNSQLFFSRILPLIIAAVMLSRAEAQEVRTWTDKATGKTIDAAYISADATSRTVTIKNAAGQDFTLPVARLNEADIEYIRQKLTAPPPAATTPGTTPAPTAAPATAPVAAKKGKGKAAAAAVVAAPVGPPAPPPPVFKTIPAKGFKGPAGADFIRAVPKTRPRLLHNAESWASLKARAGTDPILAKMIETLKKGGEDLLAKPELNKIFGAEKVRGGAEGAQAMSRMATFGVLNFIDGDPKWKERAVREIIALTDKVTFPNWAPDEMELCADFTVAVAIGYDWFKDGMNAAQQTTAKEYLVQKGMEALAAKLEGKPVPATALTRMAGTVEVKTDPKKAAKPVEKDDKLPPTKEEVLAASALILAAFCLADEDAAAAKAAVGAVDKVFSRGVESYAPGGIWHDGMTDGDEVLDSIAMVLQTMRVSGGGDFNLGYLEGMPQSGLARLHLTGPRGLFNYGDAEAGELKHSWVSTWLAGLHGNPGMKAVVGNGAPGANSAFFGTAGHVIYYNPWAGGNGTAASLDAAFPGAEVATLRSAWNDPAAAYIALKGGDNELLATQLDLGSFVLDLGGVRWAEELGTEAQRIGGGYDPNPADRSKRHNFYIAGTRGQNTLVIGADDPPEEKDVKKPKPGAPAPKPVAPPLTGNQPLDSKATIIGFNSTPERGVAIVDLTDAYSLKTKSTHRGAMVTRGAASSVVLQDDIVIKGTSTIEWRMHTRATIAVTGNKATLTSGAQTLTATLLSPAGASFSTEEPPEPPSEQARDLKAYHILQVKLPDAKGEQRITVAFNLGADAPAAPVVPLAQWLPKK